MIDPYNYANLLVKMTANQGKMSTVDPEDRELFVVNLDNIKPEDRRIKKTA